MFVVRYNNYLGDYYSDPISSLVYDTVSDIQLVASVYFCKRDFDSNLMSLINTVVNSLICSGPCMRVRGYVLILTVEVAPRRPI
jgi:hypothetical protein